jgi:hypothetical protein
MFMGCDDNMGNMGTGMLPPSDAITSKTDTFQVQSRSILIDSVFALTGTGYLGNYTDPNPKGFGRYDASFLTELNCVENFKFPEVYKYNPDTKTGTGYMAGDTVASVQLVLFYSTWFGDSLNACRATVYALDRRVDKNRYTNFDPTQYYQPSYDPDRVDRFVVHRAYSAYDTSIPDSIRFGTDAYGNKLYSPNVLFPLRKEFGQWLLNENREHPEHFANAEAFANLFPGVYIKNDYGDGTILNVDQVALQMGFRFHYTDSVGVALKKKDGTDSLYYSVNTVFASTKEVIQANSLRNADKAAIEARVKEKDHTYVKAPVGIYTEIPIPYDRIKEAFDGDTLNAVKVTVDAYRQETYKFGMGSPGTLLMLRKKDVKSFFEESKLTDNITSYYADVSNYQYAFSNISLLITTTLNEKEGEKKAAQTAAGAAWNETEWEKKWQEDNNVVLIPVTVAKQTDAYSGEEVEVSITNNLTPSYVRLKGGDKENIVFEVIHTMIHDK